MTQNNDIMTGDPYRTAVATVARLNVTYGGSNGDLPDTVSYDATDEQIRTWAAEAVHGGSIPGINPDPNASFQDFVVDRFPATGELPARVMIRPKTPFGL